MFVVSFRAPKRRLIVGAGILVLLVVGTVGFLLIRSVHTGAAQTIWGQNNTERLAFVQQFGWQVEEEPAEIRSVVIPAEFDDVYQQYNHLQQQQGFDLSHYRGEDCKQYTYHVINYPDESDTVQVHLLVWQGKIIGGDLASAEQNGFMKQLSDHETKL